VNGLQALEAGEDAQRPVERAAVGHRVDVRARDDGRTAVTETAEGIACLVHPGAEPRLLHPPEQPGACLLVRRAPAGARDAPAVRVAPEAREGFEMGAEAGERDCERGDHGGPKYTAALPEGKPVAYAFLTLFDGGQYHGNELPFSHATEASKFSPRGRVYGFCADP